MTARDPKFNVRQLTPTISVNPDQVVSAQITMSRRKAQAGPTRWQIEITTTAGGRGDARGFKELAKQLQLDIPATPYKILGSIGNIRKMTRYPHSMRQRIIE